MSRQVQIPRDEREILLEKKSDLKKYLSNQELREQLNDKYGILPLYLNGVEILTGKDVFPLIKEGMKKDISMFIDFIDTGFIATSIPMFAVFQEIKVCTECDLPVLIMGETGTGKELAAKWIHNRSNRGKKRFMDISCVGIPESILESELFGYEKGAFTGATARKRGGVEVANGGSLFLDEIGDMPPIIQAKLLKFLDDGKFRRLGGTEDLKSDTRIIAATNKRIDRPQIRGECQFRDDLYYRLNAMTIIIPPLRIRIVDILLLIYFFIQKYNENHPKKRVESISNLTLYWLLMHSWRGNVRELKSAVGNLCNHSQKGRIIHNTYHQYCLPHKAQELSRKFYYEYPIEKYKGKVPTIDSYIPVSELLSFDFFKFFKNVERHFRPEHRGKWLEIAREGLNCLTIWDSHKSQSKKFDFGDKYEDCEAQFWQKLMARYPNASIFQLARITGVSWDKVKRAINKFSRKS